MLLLMKQLKCIFCFICFPHQFLFVDSIVKSNNVCISCTLFGKLGKYSQVVILQNSEISKENLLDEKLLTTSAIFGQSSSYIRNTCTPDDSKWNFSGAISQSSSLFRTVDFLKITAKSKRFETKYKSKAQSYMIFYALVHKSNRSNPTVVVSMNCTVNVQLLCSALTT